MRQYIMLVSLLAVIFIPQIALSNQANTLDELAAMYDAQMCAECHEETHNEWKESWHSKSLIDSRVIRTWRTFILSGLDKEGLPRLVLKDACLKCHAPQIKDASDALVNEIANLVITAADSPDKAEKEAAINELSKVNINCIVCHTLKASEGRPLIKAVYGPGRAEDPPHDEIGFKTIKSDFIKTAEFCAECHHGCPPGMPKEICPTLYTSYQHYLVKGGDKTCQDCHMEGKEMRSHNFPGIDEVEQLQKGIGFSLYADPSKYIYHLENRIVPAVVINVQAKNTGAHVIPHG